jgi:hypothetical protein
MPQKSKFVEPFADGEDDRDPRTLTISIACNSAEKIRWNNALEGIREINPKAKISNYGRTRLWEMLDDLEKMIASHRSRNIR